MLSEKVFKSGYDVTSSSKLAGRENNDCFVRACSNAFGISYNQAHSFVYYFFVFLLYFLLVVDLLLLYCDWSISNS